MSVLVRICCVCRVSNRITGNEQGLAKCGKLRHVSLAHIQKLHKDKKMNDNIQPAFCQAHVTSRVSRVRRLEHTTKHEGLKKVVCQLKAD